MIKSGIKPEIRRQKNISGRNRLLVAVSAAICVHILIMICPISIQEARQSVHDIKVFVHTETPSKTDPDKSLDPLSEIASASADTLLEPDFKETEKSQEKTDISSISPDKKELPAKASADIIHSDLKAERPTDMARESGTDEMKLPGAKPSPLEKISSKSLFAPEKDASTLIEQVRTDEIMPDLFPENVLAKLADPEHHERSTESSGETIRSLKQPDPVEIADRVTQRTAAYIRDQKARRRVENGLIDPYFIRIREQFETEFEPAWVHFDNDSDDDILNNLLAWFREYTETMNRYASTGSPYHEGETSSIGDGSPLAHPEGLSGNRAAYDSSREIRNQMMQSTLFFDTARGKLGGKEILTVLRVVQSSNGMLLQVKLEQSSGRREYDDVARETVRNALSEGISPARGGYGLGLSGEKIESLWAFRTRFTVMPPMPMTGCEIEGECYRPLQKLVLPKVELHAVY